ncbi:Guanylate-binding protein 1 [Lemmus lemmus]
MSKAELMRVIPKKSQTKSTFTLHACSDFQDDNQNDCWIFALAVLLSSTFAYNSMGAIDQQAMDQLQYPF